MFDTFIEVLKWGFGGILVLSIIGGFFGAKAQKANENAVKSASPKLATGPRFEPAAFAGPTIAVANDLSSICIAEGGHAKEFSPEQIISSEVVIDDLTVSKASKTGTVGGAVVGGVLFGGVGAIVGGLSAKRVSQSKVKKVTLVLLVADAKKPRYEISFLGQAGAEGFDADSAIVKSAKAKADEWHARISAVAKLANQSSA